MSIEKKSLITSRTAAKKALIARGMGSNIQAGSPKVAPMKKAPFKVAAVKVAPVKVAPVKIAPLKYSPKKTV